MELFETTKSMTFVKANSLKYLWLYEISDLIDPNIPHLFSITTLLFRTLISIHPSPRTYFHRVSCSQE